MEHLQSTKPNPVSLRLINVRKKVILKKQNPNASHCFIYPLDPLSDPKTRMNHHKDDQARQLLDPKTPANHQRMARTLPFSRNNGCKLLGISQTSTLCSEIDSEHPIYPPHLLVTHSKCTVCTEPCQLFLN